MTGSASPLAPTPSYPERVGTAYERKDAPNRAGTVGPLRFEEGLGTDTDIPDEFSNGVMQGYATAAGRPNHNKNVYEKWPEETMKERKHMGSAAWTDAPTHLGEFAGGTDSMAAERKYQQVTRSGSRYERRNPAEVMD
jgi:hypothetical protein